jgi:hypothetical protein
MCDNAAFGGCCSGDEPRASSGGLMTNVDELARAILADAGLDLAILTPSSS